MTDPASQPIEPADRPGRRAYIWWSVGLAAALVLGAFGWAALRRDRPPAPMKPISEYAAKPAEDVVAADEAWRRARQLEADQRRSERERVSAALPYYLRVIVAKDAQGRYNHNAPEAALRMAEILEKFAAADQERLTAAKYYLVASRLYISRGLAREAGVWRKAEGPYLRAGKGADLAVLLAKSSSNARLQARDLSTTGDPLDRQKAAALANLAAELARRVDELAPPRPAVPRT